jgi:hypothetical protein
MNGIIVNPSAFRQMEDKLIQLGGSLDYIAMMVNRINSDIQSSSLPECIKEQIEESLDRHTMGISCVCNSLSTLTADMSGEASGWGYWAQKNNIEIIFKG